MVAIMALITGVIAALLGLKLLLIWLSGEGTGPRRSHIGPALMFGHAGFAVAGLLLVLVYLIADEPSSLAWTATVVTLTASLLGAAMYIPWWLRRRRAIRARTAGSTSAAPVSDLPIER